MTVVFSMAGSLGWSVGKLCSHFLQKVFLSQTQLQPSRVLLSLNYPKNLLRLFLRNCLTRLKITSETKNSTERLF